MVVRFPLLPRHREAYNVGEDQMATFTFPEVSHDQDNKSVDELIKEYCTAGFKRSRGILHEIKDTAFVAADLGFVKAVAFFCHIANRCTNYENDKLLIQIARDIIVRHYCYQTRIVKVVHTRTKVDAAREILALFATRDPDLPQADRDIKRMHVFLKSCFKSRELLGEDTWEDVVAMACNVGYFDDMPHDYRTIHAMWRWIRDRVRFSDEDVIDWVSRNGEVPIDAVTRVCLGGVGSQIQRVQEVAQALHRLLARTIR